MDSISAGHNVHRFDIRVYYEDTDAAGIVYYANYFKYAERARTEMLRLMGADHQAMRQDDELGFAVRRCSADFQKPARLDNQLTVQTAVAEVRGATVTLGQNVFRGDELLVAMDVQIVCLNERGRAVRLPAPIRRAMARMQDRADEA